MYAKFWLIRYINTPAPSPTTPKFPYTHALAIERTSAPKSVESASVTKLAVAPLLNLMSWELSVSSSITILLSSALLKCNNNLVSLSLTNSEIGAAKLLS